jgi:hypothetical protein
MTTLLRSLRQGRIRFFQTSQKPGTINGFLILIDIDAVCSSARQNIRSKRPAR